MIKKCVAAIVLVSGLWAVSDYLLSALVLGVMQTQPAAATGPLKSFMTQYRSVVIPIAATLFVLVYALSVRRKTFAAGTAYGLVAGFVVGIVVILISFTTVVSTLTDTAIKLLACICQTTLAGMLTACIVTPSTKKEKAHRVMEEI